MKLVAITPDYFNFEDLIPAIKEVKEKGASHIYVRSPFLLYSDNLSDILDHILKEGIKPIIPFEIWIRFEKKEYICHFKEKDRDKVDFFLKSYCDCFFSASSHSVKAAENLLIKGASLIFISPIFPPYSKIDYNFAPLNLENLKHILYKYGEKVVLLGGMDFERLNKLKLIFKSDFSAGGITMFFGREKSL